MYTVHPLLVMILQFARQLVRLNFPRVCLLQGGTGVLRSLGLLSAI